MDIEILRHILEDQLEHNKIRRGTKRSREFEQAFIMGVLAAYAASNAEPPIYLVALMTAGRSLFDLNTASETLQ